MTWSIGHSTYPPERFVELLRGHRIEQVADIRVAATSRRHPHFAAGLSDLLELARGPRTAMTHIGSKGASPSTGGRRSECSMAKIA